MVRGLAILKLGLTLGLGLLVVAAAPPAAALEACRIAVLGDSLTAGYGVARDDAFPVRLEAALAAEGFDCAVLNAGVSGDTSAGGASRIDWVLADDPTHLIVELGGNDALRGLPVDQLEANLRRIIEAAQAEDVPVLLAGMKAPPNMGRDYGEAFEAVYRRLADAYDLAFYPFFLEGAAGHPDLMLDDGIHPNAEGVAVIVENIMPAVVDWLNAQSE